METSIIIRTKNEELWLRECLQRIFNQTYKNFEVIIVDSGSTDKTLEIAQSFPVKIFKIPPQEFTYPYALNFGCEKASAEKYLVILSAHSLPISNTFLEEAIKNFADEKVMGVYGSIRTLPTGSWTEKFYFNVIIALIDFLAPKMTMTQARTGVMGFTNAIIRKDLWEKHHFDESYALGGEDMIWADYWCKQGYVAIRDIKFSVQHSHALGFRKFIRQYIYWKSLDKPQPYQPLEFRK